MWIFKAPHIRIEPWPKNLILSLLIPIHFLHNKQMPNLSERRQGELDRLYFCARQCYSC